MDSAGIGVLCDERREVGRIHIIPSVLELFSCHRVFISSGTSSGVYSYNAE